MAEFNEVMRQVQRMCEYRSKHGLHCNDCYAIHICGLGRVGLDTLCAAADAVMAWAAEHLEPVYPTWGEWFLTTCQVPLTADLRHNDWETLLGSHIPADLAQKLGIEPKEG